MNTTEVQQLYSHTARLYDWLFLQCLGWGRSMQRFFATEQYLFSGCKVLDIGCGSGAATKALWQITQEKHIVGVTFHGLDITPAMLELFQQWLTKNNITNVELAQADILSPSTWPTSWHDYDLIVFSGLLEYLPKDKLSSVLKNLKHVLKPSGRIVGFISKYTTTNKLIHSVWKQAMFTDSEVQTMFADSGLKITFKQLPFPDKYLHNWCYVVEADN